MAEAAIWNCMMFATIFGCMSLQGGFSGSAYNVQLLRPAATTTTEITTTSQAPLTSYGDGNDWTITTTTAVTAATTQ